MASPIKWSIEVDGDKKTFGIDPNQNAIKWKTADGAAKRASDISPISDVLHSIFVKEHEAIFETEGGSIGHKWPDYNDDEMYYAMWKHKAIGNYGPMRWTPVGALLYPSLIGKNSHHVWTVSKNSFEYGTNLPYARGHHEGTGKAKKWMGGYTVPARKLVGVSANGSNEIRRTIQKYIMTGATSDGKSSHQIGAA